MALSLLLLFLFMSFITSSRSCQPRKCGKTEYFEPFWIDDVCKPDAINSADFRLNCSFGNLYFYDTHLQIVDIHQNDSKFVVQVHCSLPRKSMCSELKHLSGTYSIDHIVLKNRASSCRLNSPPDDKYHVDAYSTIPDNNKGRVIRITAGSVVGAISFIALVTAISMFVLKRRSKSAEEDGSLRSEFLESGYEFSYKELHKATNNFSETLLLGDGGFGSVYKGNLSDGTVVAVKKMNSSNKNRRQQFDTEVMILSKVTHQNLVRLFGYCFEGAELLLVYEFIDNGTLAHHIHNVKGKGLAWHTRLRIALETAQALVYLHEEVKPPIYHRDIKSTNILLDSEFHAKVGDFGLSRLVPSLDLSHISTAPQGTPGYLDPEYHHCYQLTDKSDVYSFGVVLAELVSGKAAVDLTRNRREVNLAALFVAKLQIGALDEIVDPCLKAQNYSAIKDGVTQTGELAFRCLAEEKEDRPRMAEVMAELKRIDGQVEVVLFSKSQFFDSPTSVQMPWISTATTPNDSTDNP